MFFRCVLWRQIGKIDVTLASFPDGAFVYQIISYLFPSHMYDLLVDDKTFTGQCAMPISCAVCLMVVDLVIKLVGL